MAVSLGEQLLLWHSTQRVSQELASAEEIAQAMADLSASSFADRERATAFLLSIRAQAGPALQALQSKDPEVLRRKSRILASLPEMTPFQKEPFALTLPGEAEALALSPDGRFWATARKDPGLWHSTITWGRIHPDSLEVLSTFPTRSGPP
ncbi:MAG: hypothetical protein AAF555_00970 [Verrucomicrobiota bacterium]